MSAHQPPTQSEQTRARLLDAAVRVLEEQGPSRLSIHEVARAAGLTTGAVQHHFESKAVLMLEVLRSMIERLESSTDFWPSEGGSLKRRADHFVTQAWTCLYGQPRFPAAWSAYLAARDDPATREQVSRLRGELGQRLAARMQTCFPEMSRGPGSAARIQFVFSALRGMGLLTPFAPPGAIEPQLRVLSQYIQSFKTPEEPSP